MGRSREVRRIEFQSFEKCEMDDHEKSMIDAVWRVSR